MKDPRYHPGFGVEQNGVEKVQCDLAVQRRLGLKDPQQHFGEPQQRIGSAMRQTIFQVGGEYVSMEQGSLGCRHRPRYCLLR